MNIMAYVAGECKVCGKDIDWRSRFDKQTCSDTCRKAWSRRKERMKRNLAKINEQLHNLEGMAEQYPDLAQELHADLRAVQEKIRVLMNECIIHQVGERRRQDRSVTHR